MCCQYLCNPLNHLRGGLACLVSPVPHVVRLYLFLPPTARTWVGFCEALYAINCRPSIHSFKRDRLLKYTCAVDMLSKRILQWKRSHCLPLLISIGYLFGTMRIPSQPWAALICSIVQAPLCGAIVSPSRNRPSRSEFRNFFLARSQILSLCGPNVLIKEEIPLRRLLV